MTRVKNLLSERNKEEYPREPGPMLPSGCLGVLLMPPGTRRGARPTTGVPSERVCPWRRLPVVLCSMYYVGTSVLCCVDIPLRWFPPVSPSTERAGPTSPSLHSGFLRRLWAEPSVSCPGTFTTTTPCRVSPRDWPLRRDTYVQKRVEREFY